MKKLLTALLITASATAMASDAEIKSKLQALGAKNIEVKDSPVKGLKTAVTDQGILYVSENGQYVLQGKMYELTNKGPIDVAGKFLADKVNALKSEMIVYPAKNEKYVVTALATFVSLLSVINWDKISTSCAIAPTIPIFIIFSFLVRVYSLRNLIPLRHNHRYTAYSR
jgi:hypothetical protein